MDAYVQLLDKKLKGFNNATISGSLELEKNNLNVLANIPQFGYDGKTFENIRLESNGNKDTLITTINTDDITINDSLHLPATTIAIKSNNDLSDVSIKNKCQQNIKRCILKRAGTNYE